MCLNTTVCSNSALILWKTLSCADALCTSKRGMAVATHGIDHILFHLLLFMGSLLFDLYFSVFHIFRNVTHETSQSDQNSKSIIL
ncbi:unnamed protein product [Brassica rapa subsp. trilocularis]